MKTEQTAETQPQKIEPFVDRILKIRDEEQDQGRARYAILRRNAGNTLAEALERGQGIGWFFRYTYAGTGTSDEILFLVATLMALDRKTVKGAKRTFTGNLGHSLHTIKGKHPLREKSLERRFRILLDANFDDATASELAFHIRQMVKLLLSLEKEKPIVDWSRLLKDLRGWSHPDKYVQKNWARSFYAPQNDANETNEAAETLPDDAEPAA